MKSPLSRDFKLLVEPDNLFTIVLFALFITGLYLTSLENYLIFHGIIEIISIVIAFTIFILIWNTRRSVPDTFFLFIGIAFLFTGTIDLFHMLAYKGMGVFPGNSADLPTQLWIAARYFQSITFLIATLLIGKSLSKDRKYDSWIIFTVCAVAFTLIMASIFAWHNFPSCFIEGKGLTPFKVASEYIISLILVATVGILVIKRRYLDSEVWSLLIAAQLFLIAGELAFTSYISVYGSMNMLGHFFKFIAFYLFYRAIIVVGLKRPYDLLFRELKQKETALIKSENLLNEMGRTAHIGGWEFDTETMELVWTDEVYRIHEVERSDKPTVPNGIGFYAPESRPVIDNAIKRAIDFGEPFDLELGFITAKGNHRFVHAIGKAYQEQGKTKKVSGIFQDITNQKQSEEALRESESFNRGLVENLPDYIIVYGADGKILYSNPMTERILGNGRENLVGKSVLSFVADDYRDDVTLHMEVRKGEEAIPPYEIDVVTPDGDRRSVIVKGTTIKYHNKPAALILLTDITEHNQLEMEMSFHEQELRQFSAALSISNKKLTLLSSITRHDINNQLTVLIGYLELLEMEQRDPSFSDYFKKITSAAERIQAMIQFTKTYEGIGVNAPVWQDTRTLIDRAAKEVALGHIKLVNDIPDGTTVFADQLIVKVFYNLMDNAVRYGGKITTIRFSADNCSHDCVIVCEDDGNGVLAGEKEKIFDRGFGKNTGLGLFLSREILGITGIMITETGVPGNGARFEIIVPEGGWRNTGGRA